MHFLERILDQPIIGATSTYDDLENLKNSPCEVLFVLGGELTALKKTVEAIKSFHKMVFVHIDLIHGLKADPAGLQFIADTIKPDGIITTKGSLIKEAKRLNLYAIQRLFMLDSKNLETGITSVMKYQPDAVEILPGVLHKVTEIFISKTNIPVITGGLILDKEDVIHCLQAGAIGVSTSNQALWNI